MDDLIIQEYSQTQEHNMSRSNAGGRERWQVEVDVYLTSVDPLEFHIESPIQSAPDTDLVFHNNCHPGFEVIFNFHDQTGDPDGYSFVKHKEDAIWSQLGDGKAYCPKSEVWDVFKPLRLTADRMTLVAVNENSGTAVGKFQYALNVTNGTRLVSIDPGGNNMNGSGFANY